MNRTSRAPVSPATVAGIWARTSGPNGPSAIRQHRGQDRKSTRLNSSHTEIYTLSLHDALPIYESNQPRSGLTSDSRRYLGQNFRAKRTIRNPTTSRTRSEEHTSELQSHRDLHSFPTRRSSDL